MLFWFRKNKHNLIRFYECNALRSFFKCHSFVRKTWPCIALLIVSQYIVTPELFYILHHQILANTQLVVSLYYRCKNMSIPWNITNTSFPDAISILKTTVSIFNKGLKDGWRKKWEYITLLTVLLCILTPVLWLELCIGYNSVIRYWYFMTLLYILLTRWYIAIFFNQNVQINKPFAQSTV